MNFDIKKRYCQNRESKRKKSFAIPLQDRGIDSVEEERQFKLNRFVKDVDKFIAEKEVACLPKVESKIKSKRDQGKTSRDEVGDKTMSCRKCKEKAPMKPSKPVAKRGLFQNGVSTKFYTRGGLMGRDMTARLEENLHQIISLATGASNKENDCKCSHRPVARPTMPIQPLAGSSCEVTPYRQPLQTIHNSSDKNPDSPSPQSWQGRGAAVRATVVCEGAPARDTQRLADLDNKLYPEFTRVVTIAASETKSQIFQNQSYVSDLKRKLLEIYKKARRENTQGTIVSDTQKSSVATSPIRSPSFSAEQQSSPVSNGFVFSPLIEQKFHGINFVPEPTMSTLQYLEDTIGPGVDHHNSQQPPFSPLLPHYHPSTSTHQVFPQERHQQRSHTRVRFKDNKRKATSPLLYNAYSPKPSPLPLFYPCSKDEKDNTLSIYGNKKPNRRSYNELFSVQEKEEEESPELVYYPNTALMG